MKANFRAAAFRSAWLGVVIGASAGCATMQPPSELEQARASYQQASQDPQIAQNAPVALHEAEQALTRANRSLENNDDRDRIQHLAYLAQQRVDIAREVAQKKAASDRIDALSKERQQVLLQARNDEVQMLQRKLNARQTERGTVLTLGSDVLFGFDDAQLKPGAALNLDPLVSYLKDNPDRNVLVEGNTDAIGSEQYNRELSLARANAVRSYLVSNGIDPQRIVAQGLGESYPVASNDNAAGRQQNRRVNVVVLNKGESAQQAMRPLPSL